MDKRFFLQDSFSKHICFILIFILICWGCKFNKVPVGAVASINGDYIYLDDLEKQYDFIHFEYEGNLNIADIKKEYRKELLNLFFYKLVKQTLQEKGLLVGNKELEKEINKIKSDYPPGEFKKMLIEECIDYDSWKKFLKMNLNIKKFINLVVKPKIKITFKEVEDYYKKHFKDFYIPNMVSFTVFYSTDKDILLKIKNSKLKFKKDDNKMIDEIKKKYPSVIVHHYLFKLNQTPSLWKKVIEITPEGNFSTIKNDKRGFYLLFINRQYPAKYLEPAQAYPIIENVILQQKLNAYLLNWFKNKLSTSNIMISKLLLENK
ncbi:MAG: SurA N-terminal domain-containing protein [Desulfonauticus sp.]|nr:SurA N-terminal domain-containing protein [Desulfonauticus sp.]